MYSTRKWNNWSDRSTGDKRREKVTSVLQRSTMDVLVDLFPPKSSDDSEKSGFRYVSCNVCVETGRTNVSSAVSKTTLRERDSFMAPWKEALFSNSANIRSLCKDGLARLDSIATTFHRETRAFLRNSRGTKTHTVHTYTEYNTYGVESSRSVPSSTRLEPRTISDSVCLCHKVRP